eukprot:8843736-Heterocapsa_arctica.AAC.1
MESRGLASAVGLRALNAVPLVLREEAHDLPGREQRVHVLEEVLALHLGVREDEGDLLALDTRAH